MFLDSGLHHPGQARYDIIAAEPYVRLVTRGAEYQETFDKAAALPSLLQQRAKSVSGNAWSVIFL